MKAKAHAAKSTSAWLLDHNLTTLDWVVRSPDLNITENKFDEITNFVNARYVGASEACFRTYDFSLHSQDPRTERLAVHLEDKQQIPFNPKKPISREDLAKMARTQLTEYLKLNKTLYDVQNMYYWEMPQFYTWNPSSKHWKKRKK